MQIFDENAHGHEVEVHIDEIFEITLSENPTTGFRWSFEANGEPFCTLLDDHFEPTTPNLPGQGGRHYWRFKAVQVGSGNITFVSRRSWQQTGTLARRFTLRVHIVV
jgi:inhibitor of cysteine peptidase